MLRTHSSIYSSFYPLLFLLGSLFIKTNENLRAPISVVGRKMPPLNDILVLIPNTSHGKRDSAGVIKLRASGWDDYPGLSQWDWCNHKSYKRKQRQGCQRRSYNWWKQTSEWCNCWRRATSQGLHRQSRNGFSLTASRRKAALPTQALSHKTYFRLWLPEL